MKKWIIGSLLALAVLTLGAAIFTYVALLPVSRADTAASFAAGMKEYAIEHSLVLPESWSDYLEWGKERHDWDIPSSRMDGEYLGVLYRVRQRDVSAGSASTIYVEVVDPDLKHMEEFINRTIDSARHESDSEQDVGDNAIYAPRVER